MIDFRGFLEGRSLRKGYYGGKAKFAGEVVPFVSGGERYVEPFAGSAAVLLHGEPGREEFASDLSDHAVDYLTVVRDHGDEFADLLAYVIGRAYDEGREYDLFTWGASHSSSYGFPDRGHVFIDVPPGTSPELPDGGKPTKQYVDRGGTVRENGYVAARMPDGRHIFWYAKPSWLRLGLVPPTLRSAFFAFLRETMGVHGKTQVSFNPGDVAKGRSKRTSLGSVEDMRIYSKRLRGVSLEHADALEVIEKYKNDGGAVIYLDPPYFARGHSGGYRQDAKGDDLRKMIARIGELLDAPARVVVSGDDEMNEYLRDWKRVQLGVRTSTAKRENRHSENLWLNRAAEAYAREAGLIG